MANKKQPTVTLRIPEDMLRKLIYVSEAEHTSVNNQIMLMVRRSTEYFERAKGRMDTKKLAAIDVSPYYEEENADENKEG